VTALALTEAATRLSDRADPVPDEIWAEAAGHYDEKALAAPVVNIALLCRSDLYPHFTKVETLNSSP